MISRVGVDRGQGTGVADIECLKEIESLASPNLSHNDTIGPVSKSGLEKIPNGDRRCGALSTAGFETNQVTLSDLDLSCILDDHDALLLRDKVTEDVQQGRFARAGAAGDQDILTLADLLLEQFSQLWV